MNNRAEGMIKVIVRLINELLRFHLERVVLVMAVIFFVKIC